MMRAACCCLILTVLACGFDVRAAEQPSRPPNVVVIFTDDQGYGDVGCFGATGYKTPHLDRMAEQGTRFTHFYAAQAVCSASRAALLTGCYPNRIGIHGALGPKSKEGIHDDELTMGELFKSRGYATAIFGKWHLGHHPQFLPVRHGFDEYYGLPYSNDMWPLHPETKAFPELPLIEGDKIIAYQPDQTQLTTSCTQRAVKFIDKHHEQPFFLYVPHSMPHVPLHVSAERAGRNERGLFGDVIAEIDWSVGQILAAIDRHQLADNTLVVFTCDNGPWLSYGDHAGSTGGLREGKGTTLEGGVRVPMICRWPGRIPAGAVCEQPAMTIDLLPTFARLTGTTLPPERPIDGRDIWPLMAGEADAVSPHEALYFYWGNHLQAVRSGRWKLHFPHAYRTVVGPAGHDGTPGKYQERQLALALFDLESDPAESRNVIADHPQVVERLQALAASIRTDLGDTATGEAGSGKRPAGQITE